MRDNYFKIFSFLRTAIGLIERRFPSLKCFFHAGYNKRSLVRRIGSWLPLPPAPRVYINFPEPDLYITPYGSFYEDDYLPEMHKEQSSLCLSYAQLLSTPQMVSSTPENHQKKIHVLEKELIDLKLQVAQILEQMPTSDYGSMVSVWLGNQPLLTPSPRNVPPAPPLPPPTPPPLPPPSNFLETTPLKLGKAKRSEISQDSESKSPAALLGDVLRQLSTERPKLRHVKRSPGGNNPEKNPKTPDPSDILSRVLRKRFAALHSNTSDTDATDDSSLDSEFMNEMRTTPASIV